MDASKEGLIRRLLKEGRITQDEANLLSRKEEREIQYIPSPDHQGFPPIYNPLKKMSWVDDEIDRRASIAANCACNPANGGSGVCGCSSTGPVIT